MTHRQRRFARFLIMLATLGHGSCLLAIPLTPDLFSQPSTTSGSNHPAPPIVTTGRPDAGSFTNIIPMFHQGNYKGILSLAESVLQKNPDSSLALEIAGSAHFYLGNFEQAAMLLRRATAAAPDQSGPWTKLGITQMARDDMQAAEASFQRALAVAPEDRFAHQRLGMLYDATGERQRAIDHFRQGLAGTPPTYVGVAVDLARLLNDANNYKGAIDVLEPRLGTGSENGAAQFVLAASYLGDRQYANAEKRFQRALQLGQPRAESLFGIATARRHQGNLKGALQSAGELVSEFPENSLGYLERGAIHLALEDPQSAKTDFDTAVELGESPLSPDKELARFYIDHDQNDQAVAIYQQLIEDDIADPEVHVYLSEVQLGEGNVEAAESALRRGLRSNPDSAFLNYRLGLFLAATGRYEAAEPYIEQSLETVPEDLGVLRSYVILQERLGNTEASARAAGRMYELTQDQPDVAAFYALRLEAAGQLETAESVYRKALVLAPDSAFLLNNLASLLLRVGQLNEAEALARKATGIVPNNGRLLDTLGWILFRKGEHAQAESILETAASLEPDNAAIHYHHGMAAARVGDSKQAMESLDRALQLDASASWAEDAREALSLL